MGKLFDILNLFRKGASVANISAWKDGGNAATLLVPIFVLLAKVAGDYGYSVSISTDEATQIALGIVAIVQFILHNITSKHAGLLPSKTEQSGTGDSEGSSELPSKESVPSEASIASSETKEQRDKRVFGDFNS